jgi:hypothetical protein
MVAAEILEGGSAAESWKGCSRALAGAVLGFRAGSCLGKGWQLRMFVVTGEVS